MANNRNAGRKKCFTDEQLQEIYRQYKAGKNITNLAKENHVSRQTMSTYIGKMHEQEFVIEIGESDVSSTLCRLQAYWEKINASIIQLHDLEADEIKKCNIRYDYMNNDMCMTHILVNSSEKRLYIENESNDILHRAFGINLKPDWDDFMKFMEYRCFPDTRYNCKQILKELELDFYDVFNIIETTGGKMADDNQWLKIYHFNENGVLLD